MEKIALLAIATVCAGFGGFASKLHSRVRAPPTNLRRRALRAPGCATGHR